MFLLCLQTYSMAQEGRSTRHRTDEIASQSLSQAGSGLLRTVAEQEHI